jgi:azurin
MTQPDTLPSSTRPIRPDLTAVLRSLKPGQRIRITQTLRMNSRWGWTTPVEGVFRDVNYLATGLATDRVPEDDIVVVTVHFTKDNGELSSVTLDVNSKIEVVT